MAKIPFQDVIPPNKRSIRNISINSARRSRVQPEPLRKEEPQIIELNKINKDIAPQMGPVIDHESDSPRFSEGINHYTPNPIKDDPITNVTNKQNYYFEENGIKKPNKKLFLFIFAGVVVFAFIAFIMTALSSATVTITPKRANVEANIDLKVSGDGSLGIKYEFLKLAKSKSVAVAAKGEDMVEKKASGKIVVYNNFSEEPQRLISRTRFETSDGLLYRIPESITIPGKSIKDGKSVPGSIEVEVFADEAGEKYNINKADFTIPGFKTDKTRYTNFYAKSIAEMSGGFIGKMKTVVETDKNIAMSKLESEIKLDIEKEIHAQIPEGLILLNGGVFYTKKELPQKDEGSSVSLTMEVTAHALLLPKELISKEIINNTTGKDPDWDAIDARVSNFESLSISTKTENPINAGLIDLKLLGNAPIEANINTDLIIENLTGTKQNVMSGVLNSFPGIVEAEAAIRPIWKKTFPDNPAKIYVNIDQL